MHFFYSIRQEISSPEYGDLGSRHLRGGTATSFLLKQYPSAPLSLSILSFPSLYLSLFSRSRMKRVF